MKKSLAALALLLTSACVAEDELLPGEEQLGESDEELVAANGIRLNTASQNGIRLNGIRLNTGYLNGIRLNTPKFNGVSLVGVQLVRGAFTSTTRSGMAWVGVVLEAAGSNGTVVKLRITEVAYNPSGITKYTIVNDATGEPVCGYEANGTKTKVLAVPGLWNYGVNVPGGGSKISSSSYDATLACSGKDAIAKCVEWGYTPWTNIAGKNFTAQHQACTRAVRQDYCGDGRSWTFDGNTVDVYDGVGVNYPEVALPIGTYEGIDAVGRRWLAEGEWTQDGAWVSFINRDDTGFPDRGDCGNGWLERTDTWLDTMGRPYVGYGLINGLAYYGFRSANFGKNGVLLMTRTYCPSEDDCTR